jgi:hypothetical protein
MQLPFRSIRSRPCIRTSILSAVPSCRSTCCCCCCLPRTGCCRCSYRTRYSPGRRLHRSCHCCRGNRGHRQCLVRPPCPGMWRLGRKGSWRMRRCLRGTGARSKHRRRHVRRCWQAMRLGAEKPNPQLAQQGGVDLRCQYTTPPHTCAAYASQCGAPCPGHKHVRTLRTHEVLWSAAGPAACAKQQTETACIRMPQRKPHKAGRYLQVFADLCCRQPVQTLLTATHLRIRLWRCTQTRQLCMCNHGRWCRLQRPACRCTRRCPRKGRQCRRQCLRDSSTQRTSASIVCHAGPCSMCDICHNFHAGRLAGRHAGRRVGWQRHLHCASVGQSKKIIIYCSLQRPVSYCSK